MISKYSSTGQAMADYRARTATTTPSTDRWYCATCKQSRNIVGRKLIVNGRRKLYECEICQRAKESTK